MERRGEDYRYIIGAIQLLDFRFGVRFFVTSRDFDVLYRWWEKGIPLKLLAEAMTAVVERRRRKEKEIGGFSVFAYEVKRRYQAFLTLQGRDEHRREKSEDEFQGIRDFFASFPRELSPLRSLLESHFSAVMAGGEPDAGPLHDALLELFRGDEELRAKSDFFLRNLAPALRKPELERTYRLNYLIRRYRIPFP